MTIDIINDRLSSYAVDTKQSELNAIKEISQEIALVGLARSGFFKCAMFQGGTCLRIVHGLQRFSEDLDFILLHRIYPVYLRDSVMLYYVESVLKEEIGLILFGIFKSARNRIIFC